MPMLEKIVKFFRSRPRRPPSRLSSSSIFSSSTTSESDISYSIVVLGATGVGKTSLIEQFFYGENDTESETSTPYELHEKTVVLRGMALRVSALDISGATKYDTPILRRALSQAAAFILVYSLKHSRGFSVLQDLRDVIVSYRGTDVPIMVVGNKRDLKEDAFNRRKARVESLLGQNLSNRYFETSCKNHAEVRSVFETAVEQAAFGETHTEQVPLARSTKVSRKLLFRFRLKTI